MQIDHSKEFSVIKERQKEYEDENAKHERILKEEKE